MSEKIILFEYFNPTRICTAFRWSPLSLSLRPQCHLLNGATSYFFEHKILSKMILWIHILNKYSRSSWSLMATLLDPCACSHIFRLQHSSQTCLPLRFCAPFRTKHNHTSCLCLECIAKNITKQFAPSQVNPAERTRNKSDIFDIHFHAVGSYIFLNRSQKKFLGRLLHPSRHVGINCPVLLPSFSGLSNFRSTIV